MAAMLVFDLRWLLGPVWEYFIIVFEILTVDNVGIDTKTKYLDSLIGTEDIRNCVISPN